MKTVENIADDLSKLREKMLSKYTQEEIEKLHNDLEGMGLSFLDFAAWSYSENFPVSEILKKKSSLTKRERTGLFFQSVLLEAVISVFRAAEHYYPGISEMEMFQLAALNLQEIVHRESWPFSDFCDVPSWKKPSPQGET